MKKQIKKLFLLFFLFLSIVGARAQTVNSFEYWFDDDFNGRVQLLHSTAIVSIAQQLPVSINEGLHFIHFRARDTEGYWSPVHTQAFYKLPASATGVSLNEYEFWIDDDFSSRTNGTLTGSAVTLSNSLDMSSFSEGLHFVHIRAKDGTNRWSSVHTQAFYKLPASATGVSLNEYEFWVDDDFSSRTNGTLSGSMVTLNDALNMSELSEGLHFVHIHAKDGTNRWSSVHTQAFYKLPASATGVSLNEYEFWIDDNFSSRTNGTLSGSVVTLNDALNMSELSEGLHFVHIRAKDGTNRWSSVHTQAFYKLPASATGVALNEYEFWIDDNFSSRTNGTVSGSVVTLNDALNMSELPEGLHFVHIRAKDGTNRWSSIHTQAFYKLPASATGVALNEYEFWIDDNFSSRTNGTVSGSVVTLNDALNMSELPEGLHFVHIRAKDGTNRWSSIHTQAFYKLPASATGVSLNEYEFWIDDNFSSRTNGTVSGSVVTLNDALNMSELSEGLHFVHIRAKDGTNRWSSVHTQVFYKLPNGDVTENQIAAYRYWFDDLFGSQQNVSLSTTSKILELSTEIELPSNFAKGETHVIHFQSRDLLGRWSVIHSDTFVVNLSTAYSVEKMKYSVYPNPFSNYLIMNNQSDNEISDMRIYNVTGECVYIDNKTVPEFSQYRIAEFSDFSPGVYVLVFKRGNELIKHRLMKTN